MLRSRLLLVCACAAAAACGSNPNKTTPSSPPENVIATPGDGQFTVVWDEVAGASIYLVYYDTADHPLAKTSPRVGATGTSATVTGLTNGVAYQTAVTALSNFGESALSTVVGVTPLPALTATLSPADAAADVGLLAPVAVTFNRAVSPALVTAIATGTSCGTSTVQLSADEFAICVPLIA